MFVSVLLGFSLFPAWYNTADRAVCNKVPYDMFQTVPSSKKLMYRDLIRYVPFDLESL